MMQDFPPWLDRTRLLLGDQAAQTLAGAAVYVFGLGAVGSYCTEALARCGVGRLRLVDFDTVKPSNINRQLLALHSTVGVPKAELAAMRVRDINPEAVVEACQAFAHDDTLAGLLEPRPALLIDAIDSLNPKVALIAAAHARGIPVYSAMGAATRLDAGRVSFGPLFAAGGGCPLVRLVKKRLRRRGITNGDLWCVWSDEPPRKDAVAAPEDGEYERGRARRVLGSIATLTGIFGLRLAHQAILRISGTDNNYAADV